MILNGVVTRVKRADDSYNELVAEASKFVGNVPIGCRPDIAREAPLESPMRMRRVTSMLPTFATVGSAAAVVPTFQSVKKTSQVIRS